MSALVPRFQVLRFLFLRLCVFSNAREQCAARRPALQSIVLLVHTGCLWQVRMTSSSLHYMFQHRLKGTVSCKLSVPLGADSDTGGGVCRLMRYGLHDLMVAAAHALPTP